jgi:hypothetical protein
VETISAGRALNTNITVINNYFVGGNVAQFDNFTGPIILRTTLPGAYNEAILTPVSGFRFPHILGTAIITIAGRTPGCLIGGRWIDS